MKLIYLALTAAFALIMLRCDDTKSTLASSAKSERKAVSDAENASPSSFLTTTWRHSREEDAAGARCFRLADYAFPPSRGVRTSYTFNADNTGFKGSTAPNDAESHENFTYKIENNTITLKVGRNTETYKIVSIAKDKLMLAGQAE